MSMLKDARSDDTLLNGSFDLSRYSIFKTTHAKSFTMPSELLQNSYGRSLFTAYGHGSPSKVQKCQRSRNVSEPQLISSTNYVRESWFTNFSSTRTVGGDVAGPPGLDHIRTAIRVNGGTTPICDFPGAPLPRRMDDSQLTPRTFCESEDSCTTPRGVELGDHKSEDSLYSMDSADQDAHPLLLSRPIIPQIKLERKATVKKLNSDAPPGDLQNQAYLSPRIPDLRSPARMSSRRYGRILSPLTGSDDHGTTFFQVSWQFESASWQDGAANCNPELARIRFASEPTLHSPYTSDEEEPFLMKGTDDSLHSDVLLSLIEEVDLSSGSYIDIPESGIGSVRWKQVLSTHSRRGHKRSSLSYSRSFSSIVHAVADGCASLDALLRRPKAKSRPAMKSEPDEGTPHTHDTIFKWAPKQGQIIIKVFVPSTDDIWMFRVRQDIDLTEFTSRVVRKLGFPVLFSGSLWDEPKYYFMSDDRFKSWVKGRIRFGRNLPIVAHVPSSLPLVRLSVDGDCEVWCYA